MDQRPPYARILYDDTDLKLIKQGKTFTLQYLASGEVQFSEEYDCKLCAIRAVLLATVQLVGHCHCSPSVLRLANEESISQFAGGRN
jgi:hypothetical protein